MPGKVWGEITYLLPNFKVVRRNLGADKELYPTFYHDVTTYPCGVLNLYKKAPANFAKKIVLVY